MHKGERRRRKGEGFECSGGERRRWVKKVEGIKIRWRGREFQMGGKRIFSLTIGAKRNLSETNSNTVP